MATRGKPKKLDSDGLWNYALRVLGSRAHSVSELRQKLSRRADSPGAVTQAMNKLAEYGLTDDSKFSETVALARLQNQGFGRFRVLNELRSKRIAPGVAETAIAKVYSGTEEVQLVRKFLERKYRGKDLRQLLQDQKNVANAYRRLRTAGFSSRASLSVLKTFSNDVDEFSEPEEEDSA